jgi:hypothetical protein
MKRNINTLTTIFICLCLALSLGFSPLKAQQKSPLIFKLKTEILDYLPGYPVIAYVSLENPTLILNIEVVKCLEPEYGFVEYFIKTPGGKEVKFVPWAYKEHPNAFRMLSATQGIYAEAKIFFGANGWTFTEPGEYILKAVYMKELESNEWPISIVTTFKESQEERMNLFLESREVGYFLLFEGGDHLLDGKQRLEKAASKFSTTAFGLYANFALGANLMRDFSNFKTKQTRKADYALAAALLEKARPELFRLSKDLYNHPSFHQIVYTYVYLAEAYLKMGRPDRAKESIQALRKWAKHNLVEEYLDFSEYKIFLEDILKKKNPLAIK